MGRFSARISRLTSAAFLGALMCVAGASALAQDAAPRLDTTYPNRQPPYPDAAQVNGEQGNVVLSVNVNSSGRVRGVKLVQSSGFDDLDNAAIEGVLNWRYIPATVGGDTVSSWAQVTITFQLPKAVVMPPKAAPGKS